ncbi:MAG: hypothetical protein SO108_04235 [Bacilli bacterium]|nr:hypothetical protein [Bacilli bacterium]
MIENNHNTNLVLYDMENFLNKYTRFLSKDIYISYHTYQSFMKQYRYLYQKLKEDQFLYQGNSSYQRIEKIKEEEKDLLKLHHQKYLKRKRLEYTSFFKENEVMDNNQKNMILSNENKMIYFHQKNNLSFLIAKIKFLIQFEKRKEKEFIILTKDKESKEEIQTKLIQSGLTIACFSLIEYQEKLLKNGEKKITYSIQYHFFKKYLLEILYLDKDAFTKFYEEFKTYLYFNQDYKDFDTFNDYHSYLYKRMFLESHSTLKEFTLQEILKRKKHLRTILNEKVTTEEEVDIANFLYLNGISYHYTPETHLFLLENGLQCFYLNQEVNDFTLSTNQKDSISLYQKYQSGKKTLEVLTYELIKRRYPMEKQDEKKIYHTLKMTTMDSYVTEFISKVLIPLTQNPKEMKNYSQQQKEELEKILMAYQKEKEKSHYVEEFTLNQRTEEALKYTYPILFNITNILPPKNYLIIIEDNPYNTILTHQLKLNLAYKSYLQQKKWLLYPDTYLSFEELNHITEQFLKENIDTLNELLLQQKCQIKVIFFSDTYRFKEKEMLALTLNDILHQLDKNTVAITLTKKEEISDLTKNSVFYQQNKNKISNGKNQYPCLEIEQLKKKYSNVIFPIFFNSTFFNTCGKKEFQEKKFLLASAIMNTRENLFLLSPLSLEKEVKKYLESFKNISYQKSIK